MSQAAIEQIISGVFGLLGMILTAWLGKRYATSAPAPTSSTVPPGSGTTAPQDPDPVEPPPPVWTPPERP